MAVLSGRMMAVSKDARWADQMVMNSENCSVARMAAWMVELWAVRLAPRMVDQKAVWLVDSTVELMAG